MAIPVILPRQGQSVESCIIGKWNKTTGDTVKPGDVLFTYETDKAAFEEEATTEGTILAVFFNEGDDVPCLTTVAVIGKPGESFEEFDPNRTAPASAASGVKGVYEPSTPVTTVPEVSLEANAAGAAAVSPRARSTGERMKLDPTHAVPTGPNGRVIERDVFRLAQENRASAGLVGGIATDSASSDMEKDITSAASANKPEVQQTDSGYEDVKLSNTRKMIGKSMHQSLAAMAQLTHNISFDASNIMDFRKQLKAAAEKMDCPNITYNDIILFAVSRVLLNHKDLNAHFLDDRIRNFRHVHLGIAVDTPRGLLVPTLFNADTKSLKDIALEAKTLAKAAQEGRISPDLLTGGTFTVTNLGMLGVESFTPVINPPQTGILGVDCIIERVRTENGEIKTYPAMGLSLTYDHRAIDGAPASRFLMELKGVLENLPVMLID